jgi:DNA polymerase I
MIRYSLAEFEQIWLVDFEFQILPGERPSPICLAAHELRTGKIVKLCRDELKNVPEPPYPLADDSLFIAYYAAAEMGCHLALGWELPEHVLDLFAEFRVRTNGLPTPCGDGLLGALAYFGFDGLNVVEKTALRKLVLRDGPFSPEEQQALLDYCENDVIALRKLLPVLEERLNLPLALQRGRYAKAVARIEWNGIPIDIERLQLLRTHWTDIRGQLISRIDSDYGVYDGQTFRAERWERWVSTHGISWPRLESGRLALDDETFKEISRAHPLVRPIHQLRTAISQLRLESLSVGSDGRNRTSLSAFRAKTGRNQPSNSKFIFGPSAWVRHLILPEPGFGLAYVDWSQQEFGIAAALSGDRAMLEAYTSGDAYLAFAKQAAAVPSDATTVSHSLVRDQYKACSLAVQYGMGAESLAAQIDKPLYVASELLAVHRRTYPDFWRWSDAAVDYAFLHGRLYTTFGWQIQIHSSDTNARMLRNFPMQANGAEMLRLACCLTTEQGIRVCAPVHDALLIEAPLNQLEDAVLRTQDSMARASRTVLAGFELRSEAKLFRYPDRYRDERGESMWRTVWDVIHRGSSSVLCQEERRGV